MEYHFSGSPLNGPFQGKPRIPAYLNSRSNALGLSFASGMGTARCAFSLSLYVLGLTPLGRPTTPDHRTKGLCVVGTHSTRARLVMDQRALLTSGVGRKGQFCGVEGDGGWDFFPSVVVGASFFFIS